MPSNRRMKHGIAVMLLILTFMVSLPIKGYAADEVADRVIASGKIKCGYALFATIMSKDPNTGKLSGFAYDLMEAMGKKLDLKIEWTEEAGYGNILEGLSAGRYDMACAALYQNAARSKVADFSAPYLYSAMEAAVRIDETKIKTSADLKKKSTRIAVIDGEAGSIFARQNFPNATFVPLPQMSEFTQMFEELTTGKADVILIEKTSFLDYEKTNPGKIKLMKGEPLGVFPVVFALPVKNYRLKTMLDSAYGEILNDGTLQTIITKYPFLPDSFLLPAKAYEAKLK